jgi:hypothetical protein
MLPVSKITVTESSGNPSKIHSTLQGSSSSLKGGVEPENLSKEKVKYCLRLRNNNLGVTIADTAESVRAA